MRRKMSMEGGKLMILLELLVGGGWRVEFRAAGWDGKGLNGVQVVDLVEVGLW
jgi:hypothetical protein